MSNREWGNMVFSSDVLCSVVVSIEDYRSEEREFKSQ